MSLAIDDLNFRLLARPIFLYPLPGALSNGVLRPVLGLNGHVGSVSVHLLIEITHFIEMKFIATLYLGDLRL